MKLELMGQFKKCLLIVYRAPIKNVRHLVSPAMQLTTKGEWCFWSIVVCRVEHMRPTGFPKGIGWDFNYIAYRLYVEAHTDQDRQLSGFYFVRSDVDHYLLATLGKAFTDLKFHYNSGKTLLNVEPQDRFQLNHDSCFSSVQEAQQFLKYKTLGLSCDSTGKYLNVAEVYRDESLWKETPVKVVNARWSFLEDLNQKEIYLELATEIAPIEYQWRFGRKERLR